MKDTFLSKKRVAPVEDLSEDQFKDASNFALNLVKGLGWDGKEEKREEIKVRPKNLGIGASEIGGVKFEKRVNLGGMEMTVTKGKFEGLKCKILDEIQMGIEEFRQANIEVKVELVINKEKVTVSSSILSLEYKGEKKKQQKSSSNWLTEGLEVRVKSKSRLGGEYFGKKVEITDFFDSETFTVITPDGKVHINVFKEKDFQTVLPKEGKAKIVKTGLKGEIGTILKRDKKTVTLRIERLNQVVELSPDDICSFKA